MTIEQQYYYHTRSKSGTVHPPSKPEVHFQPTVINKEFFTRLDGIRVKLTCNVCEKTGFTTAQGVMNHTRLKHELYYNNQYDAILGNQVLLPKEDQPAIVLEQFEAIGMDPQDSYLPGCLSESAPSTWESEYASVVTPSKPPVHLAQLFGRDFEDFYKEVTDTSKEMEVIMASDSESESESTPPTSSKVTKPGHIRRKSRGAITPSLGPPKAAAKRHYNLRTSSERTKTKDSDFLYY